ncbi:MAG: DUF371 domain-containing protein [Candidatus Woesearchaeota archaeon]|jgi:hypothetical protein|nr:DUF371 domain-containing protein [Candidatus Woesearchaeota archaeon]MDP6265575.1 DUF371 domain-containing protein [Candidatus Woesearchaeota archaeon]MDP7322396.1 DUF371 domain-containing protein [Candidatus Woesearchaeota archaeon]MDP7476669.1 DUF371 domain-containing protein [Candidatus Woesearchaeota archaeon]
MAYSFNCDGHSNITARHKTTLEFTKDEELGLAGDCIVGVKADFSLQQLKKFIKKLNNNKITIIIETMNNINNNSNEKIVEKINAEVNPGFDSDKEMVIRKSDFIDGRTFAIRADKASIDINKRLIVYLKVGGKIKVDIITHR